MTRILAVFTILLVLPGCATLAVGVAAGALGGAAHFGGKKYAEHKYLQFERERKCSKLKTQVYRQRCLNRLRYMQGVHR